MNNNRLEEIAIILTKINTIDYEYDKKDISDLVNSYIREVYNIGFNDGISVSDYF